MGIRTPKALILIEGADCMGPKQKEKQFVLFNVAGYGYGIDIQNVLEITVMLPITRVPETPDFIQGVLNLRSDIVPVIDMRKRLGFDTVQFTEVSRIIVLFYNNIKAGIIVDSVQEVIEISEDNIDSSFDINESEYGEFILGIGKLDDRVVALIDIERLMNVGMGVSTI